MPTGTRGSPHSKRPVFETSARAAEALAGDRKRGRLGPILLRVAVVLAAGLIAALFVTRWDVWVGSRLRQTTNDAYVRGDITPLSAQVEGYVSRVAVTDFQEVKAGDLLVQIDDSEYRARLAQAEANVLAAEAAIANVESLKSLQQAKIAEAESAVTATRADVERTRQEAARQRTLVATTYGTQQRLEQAVADEKRFQATLARDQALLDAARREVTVLETQEAQLQAEAKAKRAMLELARIDLSHTRIVAPVDGVVGERGVRAGQYVHAGTQIIAVVPLRNVWVVANYKETQLTHVAVGQRAEVTVDSFPGPPIAGHVESIAPASGSQFSLLPPDNATGNFTKVVQRIPVRIAIGPGNLLAGRLRPGMSAIVTVITGAVREES